MDRIERYVYKNRELFDSQEPEIGHFSRFEQKLEQNIASENKSFSKGMVLKVAATVVFLLTVSIFLFDFSHFRMETDNLTQSGFTGELQEAINYYGNAAEDQLGQLNKLACCGQDTKKLQSIAVTELEALDASTRELEQVLRKNPGDDRVSSAVIRNQQMKETILKNMIQKIQLVKQ